MLRVKEIAKEKGITMQVLAKRMGITQPGLSMLLNRNLTLQIMELMEDETFPCLRHRAMSYLKKKVVVSVLPVRIAGSL